MAERGSGRGRGGKFSDRRGKPAGGRGEPRGGLRGRGRFRDHRRDHSGSEDTPKTIVVAQNPERQREQQHNAEFPTLEQATAGRGHASSPSHALSPEGDEPDPLPARPTAPPTVDSLAGVAESLERVKIHARIDSPAATVRSATPNDEMRASAVTGETRWATPERSLKFLDDMHQIGGGLLDFLGDNPEFLVVAVVGAQSAGKSTIANRLCQGGRKMDANLPPPAVFRTQSFEKQMLSEHATTGIQAWISPERIIFLDCQPLLSCSLMDRMIQVDKKYSNEFNSPENSVEMHSLQILAFLYNVSHHLLLVQDWFSDPNVLRLLQTAEMLKPSSPAKASEEQEDASAQVVVEHFPIVNLVHNKAQMEDFSPHRQQEIESYYQRIFSASQVSEIRVHFLPDFDLEKRSQSRLFSPDLWFDTSAVKLRRAILSETRRPLSTVKQTEKTWFQFAKDSWENVKNSSFVLEYSRLL